MARQPYLARASSLSRLRDHTQIHTTQWDSYGQVIGPTKRPLPDNTQHSQDTDIYVPAGFKPAIPASERPQTHALDRAATGIDLNNPHSYSSTGDGTVLATNSVFSRSTEFSVMWLSASFHHLTRQVTRHSPCPDVVQAMYYIKQRLFLCLLCSHAQHTMDSVYLSIITRFPWKCAIFIYRWQICVWKWHLKNKYVTQSIILIKNGRR
jgi:hypothetical protein